MFSSQISNITEHVPFLIFDNLIRHCRRLARLMAAWHVLLVNERGRFRVSVGLALAEEDGSF